MAPPAWQMRMFSTLQPIHSKFPRILNTVKAVTDPPLSKPGVVSRPFGYEAVTTLKSKHVPITKLLTAEGRELRRRQIDYDLGHSPFYESKSFSNTKGKIFKPPISYFKQEKAKYFPNLKATLLLGQELELLNLFQGKVSLVRIFSTVSGYNCTKTYLDDSLAKKGYVEFQQKYPHTQIIDLCVPESWLKGLITKLAAGSIRKTLPRERYDTYFLLPYGLLDWEARRTLKCDIKCGGYLYLVDEQAKIRWATSGNATSDESDTLWRAVNSLDKSLQKGHEIGRAETPKQISFR